MAAAAQRPDNPEQPYPSRAFQTFELDHAGAHTKIYSIHSELMPLARPSETVRSRRDGLDFWTRNPIYSSGIGIAIGIRAFSLFSAGLAGTLVTNERRVYEHIFLPDLFSGGSLHNASCCSGAALCVESPTSSHAATECDESLHIRASILKSGDVYGAIGGSGNIKPLVEDVRFIQPTQCDLAIASWPHSSS